MTANQKEIETDQTKLMEKNQSEILVLDSLLSSAPTPRLSKNKKQNSNSWQNSSPSSSPTLRVQSVAKKRKIIADEDDNEIESSSADSLNQLKIMFPHISEIIHRIVNT